MDSPSQRKLTRFRNPIVTLVAVCRLLQLAPDGKLSGIDSVLHVAAKIAFALLLVLTSQTILAQSTVYRCPGHAGSILLSDKPCPAGDVREGDRWTSVQAVERRKAEEIARAKRAQTDKLKAEKATAEAQQRRITTEMGKELDGERTRTPIPSEPSPESINQMTTYSVVLGRAIGCGLDTQSEMTRVGLWFDGKFPLGKSKPTYMTIMLNGIQQHAQMQRAGKSPDSCSSIRRQFRSFPWP